jgi:hypothetical protein
MPTPVMRARSLIQASLLGRFFVLAPLLLAPVLASGCGEESLTPVIEAPPPVAAVDFMDAYASTLCERAVRCSVVASYLGSSCEDGVRQSFGEEVTAAITAGRIAYDEVAAGACVAGLAATDCLADQPSDATLSACLAALSGEVARGAPCAGTFECQEGVCPSTTGDACPTLCEPAAGQGEACSHLSGPTCDVRQGLRCSSGTCVVPAAKGGACVDNDGCQSSLVCVENACAPLRPTGGGCAKDSSCAAGNFCVAGGDEGGVCEARLGEGGVCGRDVEDTSAAFRHVQCLDGLACKGAGLTDGGESVAGACAKPSDEGESCTVEPAGFQIFGTGCRGGLVCAAGQCAKPPAVGNPCSQHFLCDAGAYCDPMTIMCAALRPNGDACTIDPQCQGGYCDSSGKCADLFAFCGP